DDPLDTRNAHRKQICDSTRCLAGRIDFAAAPIAALPKDTRANLHPPGPVLRVDDEQACRADQHVVDVRPGTSGPAAVIEAGIAVRGEGVERSGDGKLTLSTARECRGALLQPSRLAAQLLGCPKAARG